MKDMEKLSLLDLQLMIRDGVESAVPEKLWIRAEVASVQAKSNGHCYLELSQSEDGRLVLAVGVGDDDLALKAKSLAGPGKAFAQHVRHAAVGGRALEQQGAGGLGRLPGQGGAGRKQEGGEQE